MTIDNTRNMHNPVALPPAPLLDLAQRLAVIKADLMARSDLLYDTARHYSGEAMGALSSLAAGVTIHALELDQIERELRRVAGDDTPTPMLPYAARRQRSAPPGDRPVPSSAMTNNPFAGL